LLQRGSNCHAASRLFHAAHCVRTQKNGIIRSELAFLLWHAARPRPKLKAGEYLFEREATLPQVYRRIARGDIYFHVVTIPEGYTMFDIAKAMEAAGLCNVADFLHIAQTQTDLISTSFRMPNRLRDIFSPTPTSSLGLRAWRK